jgi:hypothetical protein
LERVSVLETEKKDLLEFLNENWEITQEENQEERNTTLDLSEGSSLEQFIQ